MKTITINDDDYKSLKQLGIKTYDNITSELPSVDKEQLFANHTEEEWQRVIDGKFDVRNPTIGGKWQPLDNLDFLESFSVDNIEIRRELGHRQPCFGKKPDIPDDAMLTFTFDNDEWHLKLILNIVNWEHVKEFIQLTKGTTND